MPSETKPETTEQTFVVTATGTRNQQFDTFEIDAESEDAVRKEFEAYDGYEVFLRHENGGREYETVFAKSEAKAREKGFERKLEYIEVISIEPLTLEATPDITPADEYYGN